MKILVVDDNLLTRRMVVDLLTEMGHQVSGEADDGREALRIFSSARPDLVLLDLIMPGKSGLEILREIRAADPAAKVVMLTAVQQEAMTRDLLESGAVAVLHKPFMYGELEAVLKKL